MDYIQISWTDIAIFNESTVLLTATLKSSIFVSSALKLKEFPTTITDF